MGDERCQTCRHYLDAHDPGGQDGTDEDWGRCRRYPPVLNSHTPRGHSFDLDSWILPVVLATHWCGEWKGKAVSE